MVRRWRWIKWDERKRIDSFWCSAFVDLIGNWKKRAVFSLFLLLFILWSTLGVLFHFLPIFSLLPYSSLHFIGSLSSLICWFHAADDDEDDDVRQITHTPNLNQRWTPSAQVCFEFVYTYIILHMYLGLMYVSPFST